MKNRPLNESTEDITIISNGVKLEGKITSGGSIRVDGTIRGDVISQGNVTVGEHGDVNGQINAAIIAIGGRVVGSVNAKEKLVLESKANLKGDLFTKILVVEAGAKFDGKSNMGDVKGIGSPNTSFVKDENKPG
ncbi:MAG: polymer-forming cytoskeletal protein [Ignavibacteriaceae bacterium]